jgi:hypothetical protein
VLRHPVIKCTEDLRIGVIPKLTERLAEADKHSTLIPFREIRNILEQHGPGSDPLNHLYEAAPQIGARVLLRPGTSLDQAPYSRPPRPRKGLARDAARNEVNGCHAPGAEVFDEIGWVRQVTEIRKTRKIRGIGLDGSGIRIGANQY